MPRYVALIRGVSPMNLSMKLLRETLATAGYAQVKTVMSSGNVAFDANRTTEARLAARIEALLHSASGREFPVAIRSSRYLCQLLAADPFAAHDFPSEAKRVVTFLFDPPVENIQLPAAMRGARMLELCGNEVYSVYLPSPDNPAFMRLIERTFGKRQTTRTWESVRKCAAA